MQRHLPVGTSRQADLLGADIDQPLGEVEVAVGGRAVEGQTASAVRQPGQDAPLRELRGDGPRFRIEASGEVSKHVEEVPALRVEAAHQLVLRRVDLAEQGQHELELAEAQRVLDGLVEREAVVQEEVRKAEPLVLDCLVEERDGRARLHALRVHLRAADGDLGAAPRGVGAALGARGQRPAAAQADSALRGADALHGWPPTPASKDGRLVDDDPSRRLLHVLPGGEGACSHVQAERQLVVRLEFERVVGARRGAISVHTSRACKDAHHERLSALRAKAFRGGRQRCEAKDQVCTALQELEGPLCPAAVRHQQVHCGARLARQAGHAPLVH
mmetsp:Transcript_33424/g.104173  ORF Transcript_33424/g.104173 Transcript_33424/m.104173 type:complete len:331 (-) Transcript_33424:2255-3247(-)